MSKFFPIYRFDHLEFYVGNAKQAAKFYEKCFGFAIVAHRGLETGSRDIASYVMQQGEIRLVLTSAFDPDHPIARCASKQGDCVGVIALEVADANLAYAETTMRGALGAISPTEKTDKNGTLRYAAIYAYGNVLIKFMERSQYTGAFAPGYELKPFCDCNGVGLVQIDHVVGNVEKGTMNRWVDFFSEVLGFDMLVQFDDQAIATEHSALMSKVMQNTTGTIKLPINEPGRGKCKSQIEEYLEYNRGAGVQHIACTTQNIIETVTQLKRLGVEFLTVPQSYYEALEARVGKIDESIQSLAELGILVDRDSEGYLLQIFTQPVQDRPTLFFEIIERHGSNGFGEGNFKSLFEAIEREQAIRGNLR